MNYELRPDIKRPLNDIDKIIENWHRDFSPWDWQIISQVQPLNNETINRWKHKIDWTVLSRYNPIINNKSFIDNYYKDLSFYDIIVNQKISDNFVFHILKKGYFSTDIFKILRQYQIKNKMLFTELFLKENKEEFDILEIVKNLGEEHFIKFSEDFLDEFSEYFNLQDFNKYRTFSRKFCLKHNLDDRWCESD